MEENQYNEILEIVKKFLGKEEICRQDKFDELGIDSLRFVELMVCLEKYTGKRLNLEEVYSVSYEMLQDILNKFI